MLEKRKSKVKLIPGILTDQCNLDQLWVRGIQQRVWHLTDASSANLCLLEEFHDDK